MMMLGCSLNNAYIHHNRSILFTVRLKLPYSPFTAQEGGHDTDATNIQAEIADDYDLPKFFKRRSYCDQEADEDKTDMEGIYRCMIKQEISVTIMYIVQTFRSKN